ncbi:hypothetical protein [Thauera sp.]|uniref:hypothetical protein n=1 Tax=Thauera sp. TaxID=1905334 RepID=UPI002BBFA4C5|nr:hypothetical protein [Thauera sp.]HRP26377.1 hypothetical protein [Thauera sp.]
MTDRPHDDRADRPEREEARLEAVRQAGGAECEAGAQQDMRAATWLDAQADEHRKLGFRSSAALLRECAAEIRALSPLPPGSRVVVIPPDAEERVAEAIRGEIIKGWDFSLTTTPESQSGAAARAALRALTGGEP